MQLTVNGERVAVEERPGESLLQLLREQVGLRSMKEGCAPEGSCGACTVIVDGRAVVSCAQPASRFADRDVRTLEGLSAEGRADWADAFVRGGAAYDRTRPRWDRRWWAVASRNTPGGSRSSVSTPSWPTCASPACCTAPCASRIILGPRCCASTRRQLRRIRAWFAS